AEHAAGVRTATGAKDIEGQRAVLTAQRDLERTGDCSWAGRQPWVFRRSGFPIVEAYSRGAHSGLLLGWFVVQGQLWVGLSLVSSSWSTSSKVSTLGTLSRPNFWRFPVSEFTRLRL